MAIIWKSNDKPVWFNFYSEKCISSNYCLINIALSSLFRFGSIALGSIMVAILEATRAVISSLNNDKCGCIQCCVLCCIRCIEWAINYFNKYAYCHCAVYGTNFMQSASATWKLFHDRGIMALINDDLTGSVLFCGSLLAAIITAAVGYGIGWIFYNEDPDKEISEGIPVGLAVYGGVVGLILCICVLTVVKSGIVSLFVCFAEDPASMKKNHPVEFDTLVQAHPNFDNMTESVANYDYDYDDGNVSAPIRTTNNTSAGIDLVQV